MQKFVKFRFTLSALSAMVYIFGMLSDLRAVSVIIKRLHFWFESKGLEMKNLTLSWYDPFSWHKDKRCRSRFVPPPFGFWPSLGIYDYITAFVHTYRLAAAYPCCRSAFRLYLGGKLIARQATYQGV